MKIIIKGADFKDKNLESTTISKYYNVTYSGDGKSSSSSPRTIAYGEDGYATQDLVATIKVLSSHTFNSVTSVSVGGKDLLPSEYTVSGQTVTVPANKVNGDVVIVFSATAVNTEPETPTMYTFTINPTPSNATVTLTASGYAQSGNSITVPSGTSVAWKVEASGYVTQNGTHTVNKTETKNVTLTEVTTGSYAEVSFSNSGFYNNSSQGGGVTSPNTSWIYSDLIPINNLTNGPDGYCTSLLQGHSKVAEVYYASSNSIDVSAFLGSYGSTVQGETNQFSAETVKENAPEGTLYVGFSTHGANKPLVVYVLN